MQPCTRTEALYRPYGPYAEWRCSYTVHARRLCTGRTAHMRSRGVALLFLDHSTRRDEGSESRHGRSVFPGNTRYPLYRRLGETQGRSGQVWKISPPTGFDPPTFQPVARSDPHCTKKNMGKTFAPQTPFQLATYFSRVNKKRTTPTAT